jgi:hypothetical protein
LSGSTFAPFSINLFRGLCGSCFCRNPGSGGPRLRVLICQTSSTFCRVGAALDDPLPLSSRTPLPGVERLTKRGLQWVPTADSCEASIRRDRTSWRRAATLLLVGWGGLRVALCPGGFEIEWILQPAAVQWCCQGCLATIYKAE